MIFKYFYKIHILKHNHEKQFFNPFNPPFKKLFLREPGLIGLLKSKYIKAIFNVFFFYFKKKFSEKLKLFLADRYIT